MARDTPWTTARRTLADLRPPPVAAVFGLMPVLLVPLGEQVLQGEAAAHGEQQALDMPGRGPGRGEVGSRLLRRARFADGDGQDLELLGRSRASAAASVSIAASRASSSTAGRRWVARGCGLRVSS